MMQMTAGTDWDRLVSLICLKHCAIVRGFYRKHYAGQDTREHANERERCLSLTGSLAKRLVVLRSFMSGDSDARCLGGDGGRGNAAAAAVLGAHLGDGLLRLVGPLLALLKIVLHLCGTWPG